MWGENSEREGRGTAIIEFNIQCSRGMGTRGEGTTKGAEGAKGGEGGKTEEKKFNYELRELHEWEGEENGKNFRQNFRIYKMGIPFAILARFVVWLLGFPYPTLVGLGLQKTGFVGRADTKNQPQDYRQGEAGWGKMMGMDKNVEIEKLAETRMAVFYAALRTKQILRERVCESAAEIMLFLELEKLGMEIEGVSERDRVVNRLVLVRVVQGVTENKAEVDDLLEEIRRRGLELGVLVNFEKDLILDGVTTVTAEQLGDEREDERVPTG